MAISEPIGEPTKPDLRAEKSIAGSQIVTAGLAIAGAYAPFLLDYLLYGFWQLRPDPHQPLSNGFLWLLLVIGGLVVHIALGTKAAIMCLMVNLESADVPGDSWSCRLAALTTVLCIESLGMLIAVFCLISPDQSLALTVPRISMLAVGGAFGGLLMFSLVRWARKRANERRKKQRAWIDEKL